MDPLLECISNGWSPGIGDPDIDGLLGVVLYGLAAVTAIRVIWKDRFAREMRTRGRILWGLVAALMVFLTLNKQLDLQTLLIVGGRCLAWSSGWYEDRRLIQKDFIMALAVWVALSGWLMVWLLRGAVHRNRLLLSGLGTVLAFILIRAMHFFHVLEPEDLRLDFAVHVLTTSLELIGPVLVVAAALKATGEPEPPGTA